MQDDIAVGDEIITAGGMHATVREAGEDELRIEIAPGVVVTLDRRAVAAVAQEIHAPVEQDPNIETDPPQANLFVHAWLPAARTSRFSLIVLAALAGVALLGVPGSPAHRKLSEGLDLQGGTEVVLQAKPPKGRS